MTNKIEETAREIVQVYLDKGIGSFPEMMKAEAKEMELKDVSEIPQRYREVLKEVYREMVVLPEKRKALKAHVKRRNTAIKCIKIVAIALIILLITNPGMKRFKDFGEGINVVSRDGISINQSRRLSNYFIFSIYKGLEYEDGEYQYVKYIGVLLNFFKITEN